MMGVGTGRGGSVTVTDNDVIEISNLSRQFLFRMDDAKNKAKKSEAGVRVVSDLPCNIRREGRVIPCNWRVIPCNI